MSTPTAEIASSSGIAETREKIHVFTTLPTGWHYGDGVAASTEVERMALSIQAEAVIAGLMRMDTFPGINGEIRITLYDPYYLEFTIEKNGEITFLEEYNGEETDYQPSLTLPEALSIIREAGRKLWASFAYSITGTTIGMSIAFKPLATKKQLFTCWKKPTQNTTRYSNR
jgi:hypothetical protein